MFSDLITKFENGAKGKIVRAQTTYLEIELNESRSTQTFRVNYVGKLETRIKPETIIADLRVLNEHPLLIQYHEPFEVIYLSASTDNPKEFIDALERAAVKHFDGWRDLYSYINSGFVNRLEELLRKGFGILMDARQSFCSVVHEIGESMGVKLHTRPGRQPTGEPKLLLMDRFFVVAEDFRLEQCGD